MPSSNDAEIGEMRWGREWDGAWTRIDRGMGRQCLPGRGGSYPACTATGDAGRAAPRAGTWLA